MKLVELDRLIAEHGMEAVCASFNTAWGIYCSEMQKQLDGKVGEHYAAAEANHAAVDFLRKALTS